MWVMEIFLSLAIIFIVFISSCVAGILITIWLIVLEKATKLGENIADFIAKKSNKGSGN